MSPPTLVFLLMENSRPGGNLERAGVTRFQGHNGIACAHGFARDGSLAQESLNQDMDEGKHMTMKPKELCATRDECLVFDKGVFAKHILQEVTTRKILVCMKVKAGKMKKRRG
jgi:hypothetical protein